MRQPDEIRSLEGVYRAEARCFVRYVVEEGALTVSDEADRRVQGLLDAWCRDTRANAERLERLLRAVERVPEPGVWLLQFTQYNYLRAAYLIEPLRRRMAAHVDLVAAAASRFGGWPAAEAAVSEILATHRASLERIDALAGELPPLEPQPAAERPPRSANWW